MIPGLGKILPYAATVIGVFSAIYEWHSKPYVSFFLVAIILYLIYFMAMDHASASPKKSIFLFCAPAALILIILASACFIFI